MLVWAILLALVAPLACAVDTPAGKVALITGASSGIGLQVAKDLAKAGMKVVLTARRTDKLQAAAKDIKNRGGEAAYIQCDVSDGVSVENAFAFAEEKYGRIDFVFANAGVEGDVSVPLVDQPQSVIENLYKINVVGATFLTLQSAVKSFRKTGGGTIIFTSSIASFLNQASLEAISDGTVLTGLMPYAASKAAMDAGVRMAAGAYKNDNIKVYGLNVAVFASEMSERFGGERGANAIVGFNPYFKTSVGHPSSISAVLLAIIDGTSLYPPGALITIDNDATLDSTHFTRLLDNPGHAPGAIGWIESERLKPMLRDVKGFPYKFSKEEL